MIIKTIVSYFMTLSCLEKIIVYYEMMTMIISLWRTLREQVRDSDKERQ